MNLFEKVQDIVANTLNVSPSEITMETSQENLPAWDSLAQINLLTSLEKEFDLEFEVEEFSELVSVRAILLRLEKEF